MVILSVTNEKVDGVYYVLKKGDNYLCKIGHANFIETTNPRFAFRWYTRISILTYVRRTAGEWGKESIVQIRPDGTEIKIGEKGFWQGGKNILQ